MTNQAFSLFLDKLELVLHNNEFVKLSISNKRDKTSDLNKIMIKPVEIKKGKRLSFVYRHQTKDITKNYESEEAILQIKLLLENDFLNAELFAINENTQLFHNNKGQASMKTHEATFKQLPPLQHDRNKKRFISVDNNVYLQELGISQNQKVKKNMNDKFVQINKYVEIIDKQLKEYEGANSLRIADMGSGKGYLTFALYDHLVNNLKLQPSITGVEFRQELVDSCNQIARKANFEQLSFVQGTIEKAELQAIDVLIALHACDTATDEAIFRGIQADASLIVVAPCCHKQIRKQFDVNNELAQIVKHGILKERQAELITDGLRALIMEAYGYKTKVFEFISTEHTPKNVLIVGTKAKVKKNNTEILQQIEKIKMLFGIKEHYLEILLK